MNWAIDTITKNWIWQIPLVIGLLIGWFIREIVIILTDKKTKAIKN